jgi:zinc/manganese transport system substrate-binding protein
LLCALLALGLPAAPAGARASCTYRGGFAQLHALIPDRVGACVQDEQYRPDLGQSTQVTTNGSLIWHSVDSTLTFSDGLHTWVIDPDGQVQVRTVRERFPFEFNGDGLPLVGQPAPTTDGPCPVRVIQVLAVENFYASLAQQLGGQCVSVTTILLDADADPHQFQPSASEIRAFQGADLVIENGLGYDDFADKAIATLSRTPEVVRAGDVLGLDVGANPHVWYGAGYVQQITGAILAGMKKVNPDATAYYDAQAAALTQAFATYHGLVARIAMEYGMTPVAATESIFVDMANATNLRILTPPELMLAMSEETDPSARDIATFQDQLESRQVSVLVYNVQTTTPTTERLKKLAADNDIPIVGVSETMPPGAATFQGWQAGQLQRLLIALQRRTGR